MAQGITHSVRVDLVRGQQNTSYSLFLDNSFLHSGTFLLSDARAINAVELEQSGASSPSATAFALVDNLSVVPEPASSTLLLLGALGSLIPRRRTNNYSNNKAATQTHK